MLPLSLMYLSKYVGKESVKADERYCLTPTHRNIIYLKSISAYIESNSNSILSYR